MVMSQFLHWTPLPLKSYSNLQAAIVMEIVCNTKWCSCNKNGVQCISTCGICKGITYKNFINDGIDSTEDSDVDI